MDIQIISVGKLKEKYLKQGIAEYLKRLGPYAKVNIIEVDDEPLGEEASETQIIQVLDREAERIRQKIQANRKVIALAIEGKMLSSEELAAQLDSYATYGHSKVTFVIGGSWGLSEAFKRECDYLVSFGRMTLPHQLMRLVLIEQVYRAFRINAGHAYHK